MRRLLEWPTRRAWLMELPCRLVALTLLTLAPALPSARAATRTMTLKDLATRLHSKEAAGLLSNLADVRELHLHRRVDPDWWIRVTTNKFGFRPESRFIRKFSAQIPRDGRFILREKRLIRHAPKMTLAGALMNLFAGIRDENERISFERTQAALGKAGVRFLEALLAATAESVTVDPVSYRTLLGMAKEPIARALLEGQVLIPEMRAVDQIVQRYSTGSRLGDLDTWTLTHVLGNTMRLWAELGPLKGVWGKRYSSDPRVEAVLRLRGIPIQHTFTPKDARGLRWELTERLTAIPRPELYQKPLFLLMDDGGHLIQTVANFVRSRFPRHAHLFVGVEQTTSGRKRLAKTRLPFRVMDVAGSWAKTRYGSPMHGYAIAKQSMRLVDELTRKGAHIPREATVIGFGNIGSQAARALRKAGYDVWIYDKDPAALERARARQPGSDPRPFQVVEERAAFEHAHLLVSTAGEVAVTPRNFAYLPDGAVAIDGASGGDFALDDYTQGEVHLAAAGGRHGQGTQVSFQGRTIDVGFYDFDGENMHEVWEIGLPARKQVLLAKAGGVINFLDRVDDRSSGSVVPPRYIQLDIGLLYLGALEAAEGGAPGLHALDLERQKDLVVRVREELARTGESLEEPSW